MNFKSDNIAPVHPDIMQALLDANNGYATAYADDAFSLRLDAAFSELFATECQVLPLATGTAANSIALAELSPPWGAVYCHAAAHIANDEGGAPEFYSHGAKLVPLAGPDGKLRPQDLAVALEHAGVHGVHNVQPAAVSVTQATEYGTVYQAQELMALSQLAHQHGLFVHMDGARFANAVAYLGCAPAEITWRAGVDILSFGLTKNGALAAEALVVFGQPQWLPGLERRRKRGGHLLSKMRYVSAQLLAMLEEDRWLELARQANLRAATLAAGIAACPQTELAWPVQANEVFMRASPDYLAALLAAGAEFHLWEGHTDLARLVCSYATPSEQVAAFLDLLKAGGHY